MLPQSFAPSMFRACVFLALSCAASSATAADGSSVAHYHVRVSAGSSRIVVSASLPIAGSRLEMATTRPAGIPELDARAWAGLVTRMHVTDSAGREVPVARDGERGWALARADTGRVAIDYEIDVTPLEKLGWPAPREAAYRDEDHFVLVGRSLFVTTVTSRACRVTFELPAGWHATTPWPREGHGEEFVAAGPEDLKENLLVLSRRPHDELVAGGFHLHVFSFGHWDAVRPDLRRLLGPVVRHHVATMGDSSPRGYVVVLLPAIESGGESYRSSFALNADSTAGPVARAAWGNRAAHEIFHLWNGWILRGADYSSTQWFQEGFTEYVANTTIATSRQVDSSWFPVKLAQHIENARGLTTTLENIGTHKGTPLYSAGALVAFTWDVRIREATGDHRSLADFFRELMLRTDGGRRAYDWPVLRASLEATAPGDWEGYYQSSIRGGQHLPLEQALASVGRRMLETGGHVRIEPDPLAATAARARWAALSGGR